MREEGREGREAEEVEEGAEEAGARERKAGGQREEERKDWTSAMASEAFERWKEPASPAPMYLVNSAVVRTRSWTHPA